MQTLHPNSLMQDSLNFFQSLKIEGKWKTSSPKDKCIVAPTSLIQEMKKLLQGMKLQLKTSPENGKSNNASRKVYKRKRKQQNNKTKTRKKFKEWKKIPPKQGESKKKI